MGINFTTGYSHEAVRTNNYKAKMRSCSSEQNKYFQQWSRKYKNLTFSVGENAFGKEGTGNIIISKEQMTKLENDPKARSEFEKTLKQCNEVTRQMASSGDTRLKSQGFFVSEEGELQGWTVATNYLGAPTKYIVALNPEQPNRWKTAMSAFTTATNPNYMDWGSRFGK